MVDFRYRYVNTLNTFAMSAIFNVDELVLNDSFINYCLNASAEDVLLWQQYLLKHPAELKTIREAKRRIRMLYEMSIEKNAEISDYIETSSGNSKIKQGNFSIFIRIAALFILIAGGVAVFLFNTGNKKENQPLAATPTNKIYKTSPGEKKTFILPDQSKVILNAASELVLAAGFGKTERSVTLSGEAFFEVTHHQDLPFLVHTNEFLIKVLGTKFNVKAYPREKNEATLLQGSIELHLNNINKKAVQLKPDEKLIAGENYNADHSATIPENADNATRPMEIAPVKIPDGDVKQLHETAWTQNRLVIDNQSFLSLQPMLERWFDINIVFKDEESKAYVFTATFEKETPAEVFSALQLSYPFHFSIQNKTIYVSK